MDGTPSSALSIKEKGSVNRTAHGTRVGAEAAAGREAARRRNVPERRDQTT